MRSGYRRIVALLLILFGAQFLNLGAQELNASGEIQSQESPAQKYVIADVEYHISGLILKPFLEEFLNIEKGKTFDSLTDLQGYADSLTRTLVSNRIFQEKSNVSVDIVEGDVPQKAILKVDVYTSLTSLTVPLAKYNSTDGFTLVLRYKDFNFLGTLEPLSVNLDYYTQSNQVEMATYFTLPYYTLGGRWSLDVAEDFQYTFGGKVTPNGLISLSASYPFSALGFQWYVSPLVSYLYERAYQRHTVRGGLAAGFSFKAGLNWSVSSSSYFYDQYISSHYPYMTNGINISSSLPLGSLPWFGMLSLNFNTGLFDTVELSPGLLTDLGVSFDSSIGFGRIDAVRNFRKGASFSLGAAYIDHFLATSLSDRYGFKVFLNTSAFYALSPVIGFDFRLLGNWFITGPYFSPSTSYNWAEYIRGEKTARYGDLGFIANVQLPINFAQGYFFDSERFNAEVFLIPFIDAGYVRSAPGASFPDADDMVLSSGLEIVIFPEYARAFIYRLSAGYDVMNILKGNDPALGGLEIWLGLGLHF